MAVKSEITIVVGKDKVKATGTGGAVGNGFVKLDQLHLATIKVFEELLLNDTIQSRRHMEVLGQHLYVSIFDTEVDNLLNKELNAIKPDRLRLQLQFESNVDADIASLPWEFLYSPTRKDFLATDVNLVLSRYMELGTARGEYKESEGPLRVLVVISRPQDEGTVLANDVVNKIKSLNKDGQEPVIALEVVDKPTLESIEQMLGKHKPHIFHFIGHGMYDQVKRTGYLLLVDPSTNISTQCEDSTLIDRFKGAKCFPDLVFLHMCESGITEKDASALQAFSGFAPKLIHAEISSVVAMQYPIKNENALIFSQKFYSTLAEGGSVEEAVQEGRRELDKNRRSRLFGTPVLYMHCTGSLVVRKLMPDPTETKPAGQSDKQSRSGKYIKQPITPLLSNPVPADLVDLDSVFKIGFDAAFSISDSKSKAKLIQRLIKMKKNLKGKTATDIVNAIIAAWDPENPDPEVNQIWTNMIDAPQLEE